MNKIEVFSVDKVESYGGYFDYTIDGWKTYTKKEYRRIKKVTKKALKRLKKEHIRKGY